jgi:hypothetical protein
MLVDIMVWFRSLLKIFNEGPSRERRKLPADEARQVFLGQVRAGMQFDTI